MDGIKSSTKWEHFPHDADIGIRGIGPSKEEAFAQAAMALTAATVDLDTVQPQKKTVIMCEAPDDELLFVDWLNSLVYEMDKNKTVFSRFRVTLNNHRLQATAWGEPIDRQRHVPAVEVKGATYTELSVHRLENGNWVAQCVVDV